MPQKTKASKPIAIALSVAFAASCAWEPIPNAFKGLNDAETAAALSGTTAVYIRRHEMVVEYLGSDGQYREWSSSRTVLISGTWSRVDGNICQHIPDSRSDYVAEYCKRMSERVKHVAIVFSGDALHMVGRDSIFCRMSNPVSVVGNSLRIENQTVVNAIVAASALRNAVDNSNSIKSCNDFIYRNEDSWFINKKKRASELKEMIAYSNENGEFHDMEKFEKLASDHLTQPGIGVFRNYFHILNAMTKKSRRSRKYF